MTPCALGPEPLQLWKHRKLMAGRDPSRNLIHCSQPGSLQLQDFFLHLGMEGEEGRTTLLPAGKYSTDLVCEHNDRRNDLTSLT